MAQRPDSIDAYDLPARVASYDADMDVMHPNRTKMVDTALRLARYFGTSERFWLNLQSHHDLEVEKDRLADRLEKEVSVLS